jgi:hypothetical protein
MAAGPALETVHGFPGAGLLRLSTRLVLAGFSRFFGSLAQALASLLLCLRGIARARRLRENMRVEEVRCAMVGHQLRQTARAIPRQ